MSIDGTAGNDSLDGALGDDTINGLAGDDLLNGFAGDDVLNGGSGDDTMTGGDGADRFVFAPGDGDDVIVDFDPTGAEPDAIELSGYDAVLASPGDVLFAAAQDGANVVIDLNGSDSITLENVLLADLEVSHIRLLRDFDALTTTNGQVLVLSGVDADGYRPEFTELDVTLAVDAVVEVGPVVDFEHPAVYISPSSTFVNEGLIDARLIGTALQGNNIIGVGANDSQDSDSYIVLHNDGEIRVSGGAYTWGVISGRAGQLFNSGLVEVVQEELGYSASASAIGIEAGHLEFIDNSGIVIVDGNNESWGVRAGLAEVINSGEIHVSNQTDTSFFWAVGIYIGYGFNPWRPGAGHVQNTGLVEAVSANSRAVGVYFYNEGALDNQNEVSVTGDEAVGVLMRDGGSSSITNSGQIIAVATGAGKQSIGLQMESDTDDVSTIVNSGEIIADIAIDAPSSGTPLRNGSQILTNTGVITGLIRLGKSADEIDNTNGVINGNVDLGEGDDLLDNSLGVINGTISLGDGDDTALGGVGSDVFIGGAGADLLDGGGGNDTASYEGSGTAVSVDLLNALASGGDAQGDVLTSIESLIGTIYGDVLAGDIAANGFEGGGGADTLYGDAGNDTLDGGGAADLIYGGDDDDLIIGDLGADELRGEAGNDTINGGGGADTLIGREGDDSLSGGIGDDRLFGGDGDDTLDGGNRNDFRVSGQNGNDLLFGGAGIDELFGGLDDDTLDAGGGNDRAIGGAGDDSVYGGAGDDFVTGGAGADTVDGGNGNDTVIGGAGSDLLIGGAGEDSLTGGDDNDTLQGGNLGDTLKGQNGDDLLDGGNGDDSLVGGAGNDRFIFGVGEGADVISDFTAGMATDDVIELSGFGTGLDEFSEVIAAASQVGADTVIDFGGGASLTLLGVAIDDLHSDDFLFT